MPDEPDEWTATPPTAPIFPRELRIWALNHYARFGSWPVPISNHIIPEDLGTAAIRARAFYLSTVKLVEEQANWSEWGLVPPAGLSPAPIFAPFRPALHLAKATDTSTGSDPQSTSLATHAAPESDDRSDS